MPTLNTWHLPTGFVTIEDILRFCIVDLGVPALNTTWHQRLEESYSAFKIRFAPRDPPQLDPPPATEKAGSRRRKS